MSINRPLESVLIIFRQLRREVIEVSRVVSSNHRKRTQQSRLPWDFYAEFPMFHDLMSPADAAVSSLGAEDQKTTDNPIGGGGGNAATTMATADFEWDEARTVSMQLRIFLAEYHTSYVTERSLVAQSQLLPRSGKRSTPNETCLRSHSRSNPHYHRTLPFVMSAASCSARCLPMLETSPAQRRWQERVAS